MTDHRQSAVDRARRVASRGRRVGAAVFSRVTASSAVRRVGRPVVRGARRVRRRLPLTPDVSVVVPIYNVEAYVRECLDSILTQGDLSFEVIVVDDGSPDSSRAIAEEYAARDRRVRVVQRPNGGLGAARNTGLEHARGRWLTFVDSDDVLPPGALRHLLDAATGPPVPSGLGAAAAAGTPVDIAVGSVHRFDAESTWAPGWVDRVQAPRRTTWRIEDDLPLLRNLYTWNKLFRRQFLLAEGLRFREGVAYEDQPIITQLLHRARRIEVLPEPVYLYRLREDKSSISQQTATLADLEARVLAWEATREALKAEAPHAVYQGWLQTLFDSHFHWYLNSPGTVDDDYWALLEKAVRDFSEDATPEVWRATPPEKRVTVELTRLGRRADVQEFVRREGRKHDLWPSEVRSDGIVLKLPFQGDPELDDALFLLHPEQVRLSHSVENVHWEQTREDLVCHLAGWAYLRKVDLAVHSSEVTLVLVGPEGHRHRFPTTTLPDPAFPAPVDDSWCDYGPGTFTVGIPLRQVMGSAAVGDRWDVLVEVAAAGLSATAPVTHLLRSGSAGSVPAAALPADHARTGDVDRDDHEGNRVVVDWRRHEPLRLRLAPPGVPVAAVSVRGREVTGRVTGPEATRVRQVAVHGEGRRREGSCGADGTFRVTLPGGDPPSPGRSVSWTLSGVRVVDSRRGVEDPSVPLAGPVGPGRVTVTPDRAMVFEAGRNGDLILTEWTLGVEAGLVEVGEDGRLRVSGRVFAAGDRPALSVALTTRHKKTRAYGAPAPVTDGRFDAVLELRHEVFRYGHHPLPCGDHEILALVSRSPDGPPTEVPLRMSAALNGSLPVKVATAVHEGRVVRGPDAGVRLTLVRPIGADRGRYHQNRLKTSATRPQRLTRGVLMRSYFGEHATDNGLSIQRELLRRGSDLPVYWAVQDHAVVVPEGGIPVVVNTRDYYDLLDSVQYYVDNMYQPEFHTKPDGQVLVQTFHGYPFKQMGHPHWRNLRFSQARIDAYDARARQWDYLLSPARYATPLLTEAFGYPGEVLEIGYPRNDVLQSPEADAVRSLTRASLGIREDQTAVLYAPTFRDYLSANDSRAVMADFFDFAEAHRALGDGYVLLVRGHAFNARSRMRVGNLPGTVDVTDYPEVSDLYLAADVGVVDYSSLRFDFGVTGKPMVFHVPDLQRYKDTRGWLFDFEPTAPGPLVTTTADVVDHLRDLPGLRSAHATQYAAFRADYLDLEDGHAGRRFVDRVFVPRGDA